MEEKPSNERSILTRAKRIVVKVGTHVLMNQHGTPNLDRIKAITDDIATLHQQDKEIILVSSGAIGAGLQVLHLSERPSALPSLQMAASVGQTRLLTYYHDFFAPHNIIISQVLLTHDDLKNRTRHLNARNTLFKLLQHRVLPIINENDVVSVDEIKFGDNDILSALVAVLVEADCLILLTTPNGLQRYDAAGNATRVAELAGISKDVKSWITPDKNPLSVGGMSSKLKATEIATKSGIDVVIARGHDDHVIQNVLMGRDYGTHISPKDKSLRLKARKRWIAFYHKPQGQIQVDDGAANAIQHQGKSLLPIGIKTVSGQFAKGALVQILNLQGHIIAQGLSDYASIDVDKIKGLKTQQIEAVLGVKYYDEVIHRNNLWVVDEEEEI